MLPNIEFLILPFAANMGRSLIHVLIEEFSKPEWSHFRSAIAFARFSGSYVELFGAMKQFARRGGRIDLTFGADKFSGDSSGSQYVAVQEVLVQLGSEESVNVYLYHESGRTFHPKIYVFSNEAERRALVVVGSSNWSEGGFHNNVEANVLLRLDLRTPANRKCYEDVCTCFDKYWSTTGFARRVTLDNLSEFAPLLSFGRPPATVGDDPELKRAESLFKGTSLAAKKPFTRIKTATTPSPANNDDSLAGILPGATSDLLDLLDNAKQFFLCNTDRSHSSYTSHGGYELEQLMWSTSFAAAWEKFAHTKHIKRVNRDDAILMYANGLGVIGIGRAKSKCESPLPAGSPGRVYDGNDTPEWRIPVDWLYWNRNAPCPWPLIRYPTFFDVSASRYSQSREVLREFVSKLRK